MSDRGLATADAVVRPQELLVSGLVRVSLSQHSGQLALQLFQLEQDRETRLLLTWKHIFYSDVLMSPSAEVRVSVGVSCKQASAI